MQVISLALTDGKNEGCKYLCMYVCMYLLTYLLVVHSSLRTRENLEVVAKIPIDRILVETDAPWCGIKATHASFELLPPTEEQLVKSVKAAKVTPEIVSDLDQEYTVKDRSEPADVTRVIHVLGRIHGVDYQVLCDLLWKNLETFLTRNKK